MIITDVFFAVKCDRCGKVNNETDTAFWNEESIADEMAKESDWLCNIHGKHYCPNCYIINDLDEIKIKPPLPLAVKNIKGFVLCQIGNVPDLSEFDDRFEIHFNENKKMFDFHENYINSFKNVLIERTEHLFHKLNRVVITIKK